MHNVILINRLLLYMQRGGYSVKERGGGEECVCVCVCVCVCIHSPWLCRVCGWVQKGLNGVWADSHGTQLYIHSFQLLFISC